MKISILHPSFGRPGLALQTAKTWLDRAGNPNNIEYILCLCSQDPNVEQYADDKRIKKIYSSQANMVKQVNLAASQCTGDLLINVSDDFDCPSRWDELLLGAVRGKKDFVVRVDDGIRNAGIDSANIIPLPIMDRTYYNRFHYIYHPSYNHFYGDEELCRVGRILGSKIEVPVMFNHIHYVAGKAVKDKVNLKNNKFHEGDKITFFERQERGYGLKSLSLLIPTLISRKVMLATLLNSLDKQVHDLGAGPLVQVLKYTDDGYLSVGKKRNVLLQKASGDYIAFIDDDDTVNKDYVALLLSAIQSGPDCCSLNGLLKVDFKPKERVFKHSIKYNGWYEKDKILYRFPNHLNCVKASIAKQMTFPETNYGEDKKYSEQLQASGLLKKEVEIEPTLYYYHYLTNK